MSRCMMAPGIASRGREAACLISNEVGSSQLEPALTTRGSLAIGPDFINIESLVKQQHYVTSLTDSSPTRPRPMMDSGITGLRTHAQFYSQ